MKMIQQREKRIHGSPESMQSVCSEYLKENLTFAMRTNLDFGRVSFRFVFRVFRTQHHQYCLLCCLVFCYCCCCCAATTFFFGSTCVFTLSLFGWGVSLSHFRSYVPQPNCFNIRRDIISELYKRIRYVSIHIQYACIDIHRRFAWIFV